MIPGWKDYCQLAKECNIDLNPTAHNNRSLNKDKTEIFLIKVIHL